MQLEKNSSRQGSEGASEIFFSGSAAVGAALSSVYFWGYPAAVEIVVALEGSAQIWSIGT